MGDRVIRDNNGRTVTVEGAQLVREIAGEAGAGATAATNAASTATTAAGTATTQAGIATAKAGEASGSATTAGTAAGTATAAATTATTKAGEATTARDQSVAARDEVRPLATLVTTAAPLMTQLLDSASQLVFASVIGRPRGAALSGTGGGLANSYVMADPIPTGRTCRRIVLRSIGAGTVKFKVVDTSGAVVASQTVSVATGDNAFDVALGGAGQRLAVFGNGLLRAQTATADGAGYISATGDASSFNLAATPTTTAQLQISFELYETVPDIARATDLATVQQAAQATYADVFSGARFEAAGAIGRPRDAILGGTGTAVASQSYVFIEAVPERGRVAGVRFRTGDTLATVKFFAINAATGAIKKTVSYTPELAREDFYVPLADDFAAPGDRLGFYGAGVIRVAANAGGDSGGYLQVTGEATSFPTSGTPNTTNQLQVGFDVETRVLLSQRVTDSEVQAARAATLGDFDSRTPTVAPASTSGMIGNVIVNTQMALGRGACRNLMAVGVITDLGEQDIVLTDRRTGDVVDRRTIRNTGEQDDHNNPAVAWLEDGTLIAIAVGHGANRWYMYAIRWPDGRWEVRNLPSETDTGINPGPATYPNVFVDRYDDVWFFLRIKGERWWVSRLDKSTMMFGDFREYVNHSVQMYGNLRYDPFSHSFAIFPRSQSGIVEDYGRIRALVLDAKTEEMFDGNGPLGFLGGAPSANGKTLPVSLNNIYLTAGLEDGTRQLEPQDWTGDGRLILMRSRDPANKNDWRLSIWKLKPGGNRFVGADYDKSAPFHNFGRLASPGSEYPLEGVLNPYDRKSFEVFTAERDADGATSRIVRYDWPTGDIVATPERTVLVNSAPGRMVWRPTMPRTRNRYSPIAYSDTAGFRQYNDWDDSFVRFLDAWRL